MALVGSLLPDMIRLEASAALKFCFVSNPTPPEQRCRGTTIQNY